MFSRLIGRSTTPPPPRQQVDNRSVYLRGVVQTGRDISLFTEDELNSIRRVTPITPQHIHSLPTLLQSVRGEPDIRRRIIPLTIEQKQNIINEFMRIYSLSPQPVSAVPSVVGTGTTDEESKEPEGDTEESKEPEEPEEPEGPEGPEGDAVDIAAESAAELTSKLPPSGPLSGITPVPPSGPPPSITPIPPTIRGLSGLSTLTETQIRSIIRNELSRVPLYRTSTDSLSPASTLGESVSSAVRTFSSFIADKPKSTTLYQISSRGMIFNVNIIRTNWNSYNATISSLFTLPPTLTFKNIATDSIKSSPTEGGDNEIFVVSLEPVGRISNVYQDYYDFINKNKSSIYRKDKDKKEIFVIEKMDSTPHIIKNAIKDYKISLSNKYPKYFNDEIDESYSSIILFYRIFGAELLFKAIKVLVARKFIKIDPSTGSLGDELSKFYFMLPGSILEDGMAVPSKDDLELFKQNPNSTEYIALNEAIKTNIILISPPQSFDISKPGAVITIDETKRSADDVDTIEQLQQPLRKLTDTYLYLTEKLDSTSTISLPKFIVMGTTSFIPYFNFMSVSKRLINTLNLLYKELNNKYFRPDVDEDIIFKQPDSVFNIELNIDFLKFRNDRFDTYLAYENNLLWYFETLHRSFENLSKITDSPDRLSPELQTIKEIYDLHYFKLDYDTGIPKQELLIGTKNAINDSNITSKQIRIRLVDYIKNYLEYSSIKYKYYYYILLLCKNYLDTRVGNKGDLNKTKEDMNRYLIDLELISHIKQLYLDSNNQLIYLISNQSDIKNSKDKLREFIKNYRKSLISKYLDIREIPIAQGRNIPAAAAAAAVAEPMIPEEDVEENIAAPAAATTVIQRPQRVTGGAFQG
jgi:hypothetical protein